MWVTRESHRWCMYEEAGQLWCRKALIPTPAYVTLSHEGKTEAIEGGDIEFTTNSVTYSIPSGHRIDVCKREKSAEKSSLPLGRCRKPFWAKDPITINNSATKEREAGNSLIQDSQTNMTGFGCHERRGMSAETILNLRSRHRGRLRQSCTKTAEKPTCQHREPSQHWKTNSISCRGRGKSLRRGDGLCAAGPQGQLKAGSRAEWGEGCSQR